MERLQFPLRTERNVHHAALMSMINFEIKEISELRLKLNRIIYF